MSQMNRHTTCPGDRLGSQCTANRTSGGPLASGYFPTASRTGCGCGGNGRNSAVEPRTRCGCNGNAVVEPHTGCGCNRNAVVEPRTGCGCSNHNDNGQPSHACTELLAKIRAVDFALYELVLYLDAYPDCQDALDMYHKLLCRQKELTAEYESACGPLTAFGNVSHTSWDWIDKPFPWDYSAN